MMICSKLKKSTASFILPGSSRKHVDIVNYLENLED